MAALYDGELNSMFDQLLPLRQLVRRQKLPDSILTMKTPIRQAFDLLTRTYTPTSCWARHACCRLGSFNESRGRCCGCSGCSCEEGTSRQTPSLSSAAHQHRSSRKLLCTLPTSVRNDQFQTYGSCRNYLSDCCPPADGINYVNWSSFNVEIRFQTGSFY